MKESLTSHKMCLTKIPYNSKQSALAERNWFVVRAQQEWGTEAKSLPEPYKCAFCGKWHLGNRTRRK